MKHSQMLLLAIVALSWSGLLRAEESCSTALGAPSHPVRVKPGASLAFLQPLGFDGREMAERLSRELTPYQFYYFEMQNIIVLVDNAGGAHADMRAALSKNGELLDQNHHLRILGGTSLEGSDTIRGSFDFGSAIALHLDVLGDLQVEVWQQMRLVGYQKYIWQINEAADRICGTPKEIVP